MSRPEYPRLLLPDAKSCINAEVVALEDDGTRTQLYSDGFAWRGLTSTDETALSSLASAGTVTVTIPGADAYSIDL